MKENWHTNQGTERQMPKSLESCDLHLARLSCFKKKIFGTACELVKTVTLNVYFISICFICYLLILSEFRSAVITIFQPCHCLHHYSGKYKTRFFRSRSLAQVNMTAMFGSSARQTKHVGNGKLVSITDVAQHVGWRSMDTGEYYTQTEELNMSHVASVFFFVFLFDSPPAAVYTAELFCSKKKRSPGFPTCFSLVYYVSFTLLFSVRAFSEIWRMFIKVPRLNFFCVYGFSFSRCWLNFASHILIPLWK